MHLSYEKIHHRLADFVVEYEWCHDTPVRRFQGLRSDYLYTENGKEDKFICMIWPEFLDKEGDVITDKELEFAANGYAKMWIMADQCRERYRNRLEVGSIGYMVAGSMKIAKTKVIQINSLCK